MIERRTPERYAAEWFFPSNANANANAKSLERRTRIAPSKDAVVPAWGIRGVDTVKKGKSGRR